MTPETGVRRRLRGRFRVAVLLWIAAMPAVAAKQPWVEDARLRFRLADVQGRPVDSSDERFAGKVLLVTLWATWCAPCITEIPTLVELQKKYGDGGLLVVAIAFEGEERDQARRAWLREFVEEQGVNYLVLDGGPPRNFESALPAVRDVRGFPVEILVDRTGRVVEARNGYGYKKRWARRLDREIRALLGDTVDTDGPEDPPSSPD